MTKKMGWLVGGAALMTLAAPAHAQESEGRFQVKLLGTAVLPDGKIASVKVDPGLPAGTQSKASDNVVPTLAVEYFLSPNLSVETICCMTAHHINGTGALPNTELVSSIKIVPATITLKAHLPLGIIKPYIGAGPTYFLFLGDKSGATTRTALGLPKAHIDDTFGGVLQAGVDVPLGAKGFGLTVDTKRYFVRPTASWYTAADALALKTKHKLDPWVVSAGVSYRF